MRSAPRMYSSSTSGHIRDAGAGGPITGLILRELCGSTRRPRLKAIREQLSAVGFLLSFLFSLSLSLSLSLFPSLFLSFFSSKPGRKPCAAGATPSHSLHSLLPPSSSPSHPLVFLRVRDIPGPRREIVKRGRSADIAVSGVSFLFAENDGNSNSLRVIVYSSFPTSRFSGVPFTSRKSLLGVIEEGIDSVI